MSKFSYDLDEYNLFGEPCKVPEMLACSDADTNQSIEDRKDLHEEYDGYEKFYACWAVHETTNWTGMLILDVSKLDANKFIIATGIGY